MIFLLKCNNLENNLEIFDSLVLFMSRKNDHVTQKSTFKNRKFRILILVKMFWVILYDSYSKTAFQSGFFAQSDKYFHKAPDFIVWNRLSNGETDGDKESDGDDEIKWWDEIQTVTWNSNGENLSQMVIFQK